MHSLLPEGISTMTLALGLVGVAVMVYAAYLYVDQWGSLVFCAPRPAAQAIAPVVLVVVAVGNYLLNGRGADQVAAGLALLGFALLMLVARTGVGRAGIYAEGVRRPWGRVDDVKVGEIPGEEGAAVTWVVRGTSRALEIPGADPREVEEFVREMLCSHSS